MTDDFYAFAIIGGPLSSSWHFYGRGCATEIVMDCNRLKSGREKCASRHDPDYEEDGTNQR